ncbi:MAG: DUF1566 domain-containing protein [gamma proteobacterium symbiont of Lucinoma myriamae]|nr:DUF1566 domain-containing protein [gamma proteobacterium symbiont of Lucinoma myriamae]
MKRYLITLLSLLTCQVNAFEKIDNYPIVDTGQDHCYNNSQEINCKTHKGATYYGQDGDHHGLQPSYTDNNDGTVTDNNTGLMWQQQVSARIDWQTAVAQTRRLRLGGYSDWRVPTIKELYSLINFNGSTGMIPRHSMSSVPADARPYINTDYFDFNYSSGRRFMDAQYWSSTEYVSRTMGNTRSLFGVNFADGRIKAYPKYTNKGGRKMKFFIRYVVDPEKRQSQ